MVLDSSPGPDGLPYSASGAAIGGIASLFRVLVTLGAQALASCNASLVTFIRKGVTGTGGAYAEREAEYHPLTLADTSQKLVAKALDGS